MRSLTAAGLFSHISRQLKKLKMELKQDFDWSIPPKKKFKQVQVLSLCPIMPDWRKWELWRYYITPLFFMRPQPQRWRSSTFIKMIFFMGASSQFCLLFCHFDAKGEKIELVSKRVYLFCFFSCNSWFFWRVSMTSCNFSRLVVWYFLIVLSPCFTLNDTYVHAWWILSGTNFHHASQFLHIIWSMHDWIPRYRGDLHNSIMPCTFAIESKFIISTSSWGVPLNHVIKFFILCSYTSIIYPHWKLKQFVINHQKGGDCKCI